MTQARRILRLSGSDCRTFLQSLVTNDIEKTRNGLVYAALLTPQGKYMADFFIAEADAGILLDVAEFQGDMLAQRLMMYKLRADVQIETTDLQLHQGLGAAPADGWVDPRDPALGWRAYRPEPIEDQRNDWDELYVRQMIPRAGTELHQDSFILEMGFERLNGVDFRKGCYVGQEVTARMKHKTELRKGLALVSITGKAEPGTEIIADGKVAGTLYSVAGDSALAYLRYDRASIDMQAGAASVRMLKKAL